MPIILKNIEKSLHTFFLGLIAICLLFINLKDTIASGFYIDRRLGIDISYPQCGKDLPNSNTFGIVGINGGRPFTQNKCLKEQYQWGREVKSIPAVYINLSAPNKKNQQVVWEGPKSCSSGDLLCQNYNWGYQGAAYAYSYAQLNNITTPNWWLDIEVMNTWDSDKALNAQVIQGAIDLLQSHKLKTGIYSTSFQWNKIAGLYSPNLPIWAAGAKTRDHAMTFCGSHKAFGGGNVVMVQWLENNFDHNLLCPLN